MIIENSDERLGLQFKGNAVFSLLCVSSLKSRDSTGDYWHHCLLNTISSRDVDHKSIESVWKGFECICVHMHLFHAYSCNHSDFYCFLLYLKAYVST